MTFAIYRDDEHLSLLSWQCSNGGRVALSFFLGGVVICSYALSRSTTNHQYIWWVWLISVGMVYIVFFRDLILLGLKKCWNKLRHTHHMAPPIVDPLDQMYREIIVRT